MPQDPRSPRILVFSRTTGFRHDSIEPGVDALDSIATDAGLEVEATEDAAVFTDADLERFGAVVWLNTSGDVFDDAQRAAFRRYIEGGGGYVGIHGASDTEYGWAWYGDLVGTWFDEHPAIQPATVHVVDRGHPATRHLPPVWHRTDEWYDFIRPPRGGVRVLASIDETSYEGGKMGEHHPIAWCHEFEGGRAFYTAMGHTEDSYVEEAFLDHVLGGIRWALHHTT